MNDKIDTLNNTHLPQSMRLDQFLSLCCLGTRKKVKEFIYAGDVSINGEVCTVPATHIDEKKDRITYQDTSMKITPRYYLLHKPQDCICARESHSFSVFDCLNDMDTTGLFSVGRLDKDTEGLLIITNDGVLNHQLMWPDHHVTKTYYFLCLGTITPEKISLLERGITLAPDEITKPASFSLLLQGDYEIISKFMEDKKLSSIKKRPIGQQAFLGTLTISEGKKHQVKRMLRHVGCPILYLKRIAVGSLELPDSLSVGTYQEVTFQDLSSALK